ncbi:hypothetical protein V9K67_00365 [Paraflavisolibacter sp. H34]|uniref:hypothetical protein n=1 Tax=Huijunlia imazamoxiresistens TaxID=3127457 RepID=UPI003016F093
MQNVTGLAKQQLSIKTLLATTKAGNTKALRLVEKMGFVAFKSDDQEVIVKKEI